jgi:hypothetical protein
MKLRSALACIVALTACDQSTIHDQCMRTQIFRACIATTAATNDIVEQCDSAAAYQSLRKREHVKPECRP